MLNSVLDGVLNSVQNSVLDGVLNSVLSSVLNGVPTAKLVLNIPICTT
jgi:hypothetical protein